MTPRILESLSSPWVPASLLVVLAAAGRIIRRSWLSPAALVGFVWAVYVVGCLLFTNYEIFPEGIWIIVLFVFAIQFGSVLAEGLWVGRASAWPRVIDLDALEVWSRRSFQYTILLTATATAGAMHLLAYSLQRFSLGFSFAELLALGHFWSVVRYENAELEPWSVRLLIMWVYPAALLAGICFATARTRLHKFVSFVPFVPVSMIAALLAVRAGLAFATVCWLSGFFAIKYHTSSGVYALFQRKHVISIVSMLACGLVFFVAIDTLRIFQGGDVEEARVDLPRISKYFFGAVPALCDWVHYSHPDGAAFGAYTFSGVFDLVGLKHRELGLYQDSQTLSGGEQTNIYTMFRGLIEDFTVSGMCLFALLLGLLAGLASRVHARNPAWPVLVLAGYYAVLLFSPLTSIFTYNGLILAWVVAALVLGWRWHPRSSPSPISLSA